MVITLLSALLAGAPITLVTTCGKSLPLVSLPFLNLLDVIFGKARVCISGMTVGWRISPFMRCSRVYIIFWARS